MTTQDEITAWEAGRARVTELVVGLDPDQLATHVPACPDWTVRDLLSHVVGLPADVLDGDEPDDHDPGWTQAQVDARSGRTAEELLAEWDDLAPRLVAWMAEHGTRPLNDLVIHEQDLRGAVDRPGGRDSDGLARVRDRMAGRLDDAASDLPPLALVATDDDWRWCTRGPVDDAEVVLRAPAFDLARALMSRRTAEQLRGWTVRGDVDGHLDAFAGLGPLPDQALPE